MDTTNQTNQTNQTKMYETMAPTKLFFRCALLSMISMAMTSVYNIADGIFVGNFIGSDALAAVNLVMPLVLICFALADMIAVGSSVQIAIKLGEKDQQAASGIFSFCSFLIIGISVIVGILMLVFAEPILRLMGADAAVTQLAVDYLMVFAVFAPGIMIFFALDNYLRICGKQKYSMWVNVATAVLNIVLDFLFIVVFGWGIASAAFASCLSMMLGTVLCIAPFLAKKMPLHFRRATIKLRQLGNIIANGSSEFFGNIAGSFLMLVINSVLLHLSGSLGVAAFSVVMYVDSVVSAMIYGMTDSMQPAIGYNYGAHNFKRVIAIEKRVLCFAGLLSLVFLLLMEFKGNFLISMFIADGDTELLAMSVHGMQLFALGYLIKWFNTVGSAFFTALDKPRASLIIAFLQAFIAPLLCIGVLTKFIGIDGIWLSSVCSSLLTALVTGFFFIRVIRELRRVKKGELAATAVSK